MQSVDTVALFRHITDDAGLIYSLYFPGDVTLPVL